MSPSEQRNAYSVLGLYKGSSADQIKHAYVNLVKKYDPEVHTQQFMVIQDAFNRLKEPERRALEDILSFNNIQLEFQFSDQEKAEVTEERLTAAVQQLEQQRNQAAPGTGEKYCQVLMMRSWQNIKKKLLNEALEDWKKVLEIDPTHQRAKNNLLCAHCRLGFRYTSHQLFEEAIKEYEQAARMNPDNVDLIHNLALAFEFSGNREQCTRFWNETIRRWKLKLTANQQDEYLKLMIIQAHRHLADMNEHAPQAQQPSPTRAQPTQQGPSANHLPPQVPQQVPPQQGAQGQAQQPQAQATPQSQASSKEDELQQHVEILKLNPEDFDANYKVARILIDMKKWKEAVLHLQNLTRKFPRNIEVLNALGWALLNTQQVDQAIQTWYKALKLDPKNFQVRESIIKARMMLGRALRDKGLFVNALVHFKALARLTPDSAELHFELGKTYQLKGDIRSAFKEYQLCVKVNPKHKEARLAMSDLKMRRG